MENEKKCAAIIQLGMMVKYFEGYDCFDIINKMSDYQDMGCLCLQAQEMGTKADAKEARRLEDWLYNFEGNPGDMHRFDTMDFKFSIGRIKCYGWAEGEEECRALLERYKKA